MTRKSWIVSPSKNEYTVGEKRRLFQQQATDFTRLIDTRVAIITQNTYIGIMDNLPSVIKVVHVESTTDKAMVGHSISDYSKAQIVIVAPDDGLLLGWSDSLTCTEIVAEERAIAKFDVDRYGERFYQSVDGLVKVDTNGVLGFIDKMIASVRPKVELQKSQVVMALLQKANGCQVQTDSTTTFINFRGDGIKVDCDFQQDKALLTIYGNGSYKEVTITRVDDLADINFNY